MSSLSVDRPSARKQRLFAALRLLAWCYLAALASFVLLLAVGERWWVAVVALYLPRFALLVPLAILFPLAWSAPHRRLFALQALVAAMVVVWIAGPHVSPRARPSGGPSLRVQSYNVWYGTRGMEGLDREIDAAKADVVLLQAVTPAVVAHFRERFGEAMHTHAAGDFFLASAFPITSVGTAPSPGFLRATLDSPLGPIDVFDVHPPSPRSGLAEVRHQSKRRFFIDGPSAEAAAELMANTALREQEIAAVARAAAESHHPVVIGGDLNLPELSAVYRQNLSRFQDGFREVGNGFGYTFPANAGVPWMRIDRVLAGRELRFTSFTVGGRGGSDHCPVWADIERR